MISKIGHLMSWLILFSLTWISYNQRQYTRIKMTIQAFRSKLTGITIQKKLKFSKRMQQIISLDLYLQKMIGVFYFQDHLYSEKPKQWLKVEKHLQKLYLFWMLILGILSSLLQSKRDKYHQRNLLYHLQVLILNQKYKLPRWIMKTME